VPYGTIWRSPTYLFRRRLQAADCARLRAGKKVPDHSTVGKLWPAKAGTPNPAAINSRNRYRPDTGEHLSKLFLSPQRLGCNPRVCILQASSLGSCKLPKVLETHWSKKFEIPRGLMGPKFDGIPIANGSYPNSFRCSGRNGELTSLRNFFPLSPQGGAVWKSLESQEQLKSTMSNRELSKPPCLRRTRPSGFLR
jgi:hypothetical protein